MAKGKKLSEKERRFVEAYMGEAVGNASEAARIAGYSSPGTLGHRLLKKVQVQEALARRQAADPLIATREERQKFWSDVFRGNLPEFDTKDRLKASELLGKCGGDFLDRIEHSGQVSIPQISVILTP